MWTIIFLAIVLASIYIAWPTEKTSENSNVPYYGDVEEAKRFLEGQQMLIPMIILAVVYFIFMFCQLCGKQTVKAINVSVEGYKAKN